MAGDYERDSYRPRLDFSGLLRQQGRVGLAADHNELVRILDRRNRAPLYDLLGRAVVPVVNPENEHAFEILLPVAGNFQIGLGRIYVDGMLVDNRGWPDVAPPQREFDAVLGEERGRLNPNYLGSPPAIAGAPPYGQPYCPDLRPDYPIPEALSAAGSGDTDLIYLDVWEREVTVVEEPALREVALGGPDTATRLQTVWQVRALPDVGDAQCETVLGVWDALTAPSSLRLTTSVAPRPPAADPCVLGPDGGYTGLENRFYRVEIHAAGAIGTGAGAARFKWSRDNASLTVPVEQIANVAGQGRITVETTGTDRLRRFAVGDWVEVLSDRVEFAQAAGTLARVLAVDPTNRIITVDRILPVVAAADAARWHWRARHWHGADLDVQAGPFELENGIRLAFAMAPGGNTVRVGDYWTFAARTADASVEVLDAAPPRGILHHYTRLGLITWAAGGPVVQDCRVLWEPGEGCCTEVVEPGESIQAAIDRLPAEGGCVCLKAGMHVIREPIRIVRSFVSLHGESLGAMIRSERAGDLLIIGGRATIGITVHDLTFLAEGDGLGVVQFRDSVTIGSLRDCVITSPSQERSAPTTGVLLAGSHEEIEIADNKIMNLARGIRAVGRCSGLAARNNTVAAGGGDRKPLWGSLGIHLAEGLFELAVIEGNEIEGYATGIALERGCVGARVGRNRVLRSGPALPGVENPDPVGWGAAGNPLGPQRWFGIVTAASAVTVADNFVLVFDPEQAGIHLGAWACSATGNQVVYSEAGPAGGLSPTAIPLSQVQGGSNTALVLSILVQRLPLGIVVQAGARSLDAGQSTVRGNTVLGGMVHVAASFGAHILPPARIAIESNVLGGGDRETVVGLGILLNGVPECLVEGNRIDGLAVSLLGARVVSTSIAANQCLGTLMGFMLQGTRVHVSDNQVRSDLVGLMALSGSDLEVCGSRFDILERLEGARGMGIVLRDVSGARIRDNRIQGPWSGIVLATCRQPEIRGNELTDIGLTGISLQGGEDPRILHNRVRRCGSLRHNGAIGIGLGGITGTTVEIAGNEVRELGQGRADGGPPASTGILASILRDCQARDNDVEVAIRQDPAQQVGISLVCGRFAQLVGNAVRSPGHSPLIRVVGVFKGWSGVICSTNRAIQDANANVGQPAVRLAAAHVSLVGNQVRSGAQVAPMNLQGTARVTAVGNVTSNGNWVGVPANLAPQPLPGFNHLVF